MKWNRILTFFSPTANQWWMPTSNLACSYCAEKGLFLQKKQNRSQTPLKSLQLFPASCCWEVYYKTNLSSSSAVMMCIVKLATGNATAVLKRFNPSTNNQLLNIFCPAWKPMTFLAELTANALLLAQSELQWHQEALVFPCSSASHWSGWVGDTHCISVPCGNWQASLPAY